ncbi:MAG TPA: hypothetical protein VFA67_13795 [Candidatus Sulfotelmatobacter sp.]|jgi:hypothetical protein|nr:hypothetical protein [Candidatus Sulfotelmatobacter sp.]
MTDDLRPITSKNLPDAIRLINESSEGTSTEYHLDFFSFLNLWRFWNFSLAHSLIRYIDNEPASIVINCVDPESREAYNFYWGALPKFRTTRSALSLFDACCHKLHEDGYLAIHGDSLPERPVRRYRFINAQPGRRLLDLKAQSPRLPAPDPAIVVKKIDIQAVLPLASAPGQFLHWSQRPAFLRNIAAYTDVLGAFSGDTLKAYTVVPSHSPDMRMFDLRSPEAAAPAVHELLRFVSQNYPSPVIARHVLEESFTHRLLSEAGFEVVRQVCTLHRDLRATRATKQAS